jgi:hypothetical protein
VSWDHANSEVKIVFKTGEESEDEDSNFVIMTMGNSVEFEGEMKLRYVHTYTHTYIHTHTHTHTYIHTYIHTYTHTHTH